MKDLIYSNRVYELRKSYGISQDQMAAYFNLLIPDVFPLAKEIHLASCEECIKK